MNPLFQVITLAAAVAGAATHAIAGVTVYVPLGSAGEVLVVDADKDRIVGTIPGLPDVHGLAGTADGKVLVAGSYAETTPGEAAAPPKPAGMSEAEHRAHHAAPAKQAREPRKAVSFVSIIGGGDMSVVRRIEVAGAVHHTAVTPDGRYAVATHPNNGGISVIDLARFEVMKFVRTGPMPNYAVVAPDGRRVYVSNAGNGTISEIGTDGWAVRRTFAAGEGPEHMVLSPDGGMLYVNNADAGSVSAIDLGRGVVTRTFEIGGELHGIDLSDNGKTLFVSGKEENKLVAIDLTGGGVRSVPLAPAPYHLTAVRGTGKLYVSSRAEPKIWVVDAESLRVINEIAIRGEGHQMVVTH